MLLFRGWFRFLGSLLQFHTQLAIWVLRPRLSYLASLVLKLLLLVDIMERSKKGKYCMYI
jgi:hypothetical protein